MFRFLFPLSFAGILLSTPLLVGAFEPATEDLPPRVNPASKLQDSSSSLKALIYSTEQQLELQREVAELVSTYELLREQLFSNPESAELATQVVSTAYQLSDGIEEGQLADLFSSDFLRDLHFFSAIAEQSGTGRG